MMTTRRQFICLLGGAAAASPMAGHAQQPERVRRVGVLMSNVGSDDEGHLRIAAFVKSLSELGWATGQNNLAIDTRWGGGGDSALLRRNAEELVTVAPDVILASGGVSMQALLSVPHNVPIVFTQVLDPVGAGYVVSLARPGGNITGFTNFEYGMTGKWVELLKQISPHLTRAAVLRDPAATSGTAQFAAIQAVAPSLRVELTPLGVRDLSAIESGITAFARAPDRGLIVVAGARVVRHRNLIIALAARHRLPAIYYHRYFVTSGGLISYGPNTIEQFRSAAGYVSRILKGEKPADLPVQAPTKYELVINLKTAKALGIDVPPMLLARADEVIE